MPACHRCGKANQPKVEVRQTARGFVCKDLRRAPAPGARAAEGRLMARKNRGKTRPQHAKGLKRPRGWHRKAISPEMSRAAKWLSEEQRRRAA